MFDFAWSEILLIGAVALIAIGPKDMPAAIRTVSGMIKKARRMAAEFQTHVDEMVREADLGDVKKAFNDIRNLDLTGTLEKHVDPDRSIRNTFAENPFEPTYPTPARSRRGLDAGGGRGRAPRRPAKRLPNPRYRLIRGSWPNRKSPWRRHSFRPAWCRRRRRVPPRRRRGARFHSPRGRAATPVQGVGVTPDHRKAERGKT